MTEDNFRKFTFLVKEEGRSDHFELPLIISDAMIRFSDQIALKKLLRERCGQLADALFAKLNHEMITTTSNRTVYQKCEYCNRILEQAFPCETCGLFHCVDCPKEEPETKTYHLTN